MAETNITAGEGSPEQLPRGAAAALNDNTNVQEPTPLDVQTESAPEEEEEVALDQAEPKDYEPAFVAESEDDEFITGPTTRPDESVTAGVTARSSGVSMSASIRRSLPALVQAANQPGASEQMRLIVRWAAREANR